MSEQGATAALSAWAANFTLDDAPAEVVERMKALVLDFLRVVTVGQPLPWSRAARNLTLQLGGKAESSLVLCGSKVDAARAAFVNGAYAHACDLDDTHVGSMHHAGAGRLQATVDAGLALGRTRGAAASLRSTDYDTALKDAEVRALSNRTRCVLDPWVEAGTNTEEVPTRVTIKIANGNTHEMKIEHPRGSPHRRMAWAELTALFNDTVGDALPADRRDTVQLLVAGLDGGSSVREVMRQFVATPAWLAKS